MLLYFKFVYVSTHVCILANMFMLLEKHYLDSGTMAAKYLPFHYILKYIWMENRYFK